jgi:hypothetical protein
VKQGQVKNGSTDHGHRSKSDNTRGKNKKKKMEVPERNEHDTISSSSGSHRLANTRDKDSLVIFN